MTVVTQNERGEVEDEDGGKALKKREPKSALAGEEPGPLAGYRVDLHFNARDEKETSWRVPLGGRCPPKRKPRHI